METDRCATGNRFFEAHIRIVQTCGAYAKGAAKYAAPSTVLN